jgi:hypothetical protein
LEGRKKRIRGHWNLIKYEAPVSFPHFGQGNGEDDQGFEGGRRVQANRDSIKFERLDALLDESDGSTRPQVFLNEPIPKVLFDLAVEEEMGRRFDYCEANGTVGVNGIVEL